MKGDFTRFSFDPTKHYNGVRMQQGRVQLDCDWNEQIETQTRLQELLTADLVGVTGAPETGGGFQVSVSADGKTKSATGTGKLLLISPGRLYAGGLLCELNAATTYDEQTDYPGALYPTLADLSPVIAGAPPPAPPATGTTLPGKDVAGNDVYLAYLDAWPRHVTALEDPSIAEIALGGPDTGTRVQTLAQVKLAPLSADGSEGTPPILVPVADWARITAPSLALLAAAAFVPDSPGSLSVGGAAGFVKLPAFASGAPDFSQGFAVEAWVYVNGRNTTVPILYLGDGTAPNTISLVGGGTDGVVSAPLVLTVGSATCTAPAALDPGQWTYVAASITSSGAVTMYKNGSVVANVAKTGTLAAPPNVARGTALLGSTSTTAATFSAMLAEVRVWSGAGFTGPVVSSRITGSEANLVAYYKLNQTDDTTSVVDDFSAARRNGAVTGTVTWSPNAPALSAAGSSTAQYSGAENQLYRVEIHSVKGGVVTFKWSRDNGSIAANATLSKSSGGTSPTQTLTLTTPVRDDVLGWALGQYVEITTPRHDLEGVTGTLAQITDVLGSTLTIAAVAHPNEGPVTVRRWDSNPTHSTFTLPASAPTAPWQSPWMPLENGIAVQFGGQAFTPAPDAYWLPFKPGDYWTLPARTATQAIEWPVLASTQPEALSPLGVIHQYAKLAKVYLTSAGTWKASPMPELRQVFPPMEKALFSTGVLTFDTNSVLVGGTFNVGTPTAPQTSNFWGPVNIGAAGHGEPLNVWGPINAADGINVTGAAVNIGTAAAPQPLNMFGPINLDDYPINARTGDTNHGLIYAGHSGGTPFTGNAASNVDGPVLYGLAGGGLGSKNGSSTNYALTWDSSQNVRVNGTLTTVGALNATDGLTVTGAPLNVDTSLRMNDNTIWFRTGTDVNHGLRYGGFSGGTPFATPNQDGPVLFGWGGGGLGTTNGGNKYALTWDSSQNVRVSGALTTVGALNATDGLTVTGAPLTITGQPLDANGVINANAGLVVTGTLNANGAVNANAGLTVTSGVLTVSAGVIQANDGINVSGAPLNAYTPILAQDGLTVTGAATNIGYGGSASLALNMSSPINLDDNPINARTGDTNHGLVYAGHSGGTPFTGSAASNVDGPVLYGFAGGGLGSKNGSSTKYALTWDSSQNVVVNGQLTASSLQVDNAVNLNGTTTTHNNVTINGQLAVEHANVTVNGGNFTVTGGGTKNFQIPHPTDPERDLVHSCLEGPEAGVYYRGEGRLIHGVAAVELPAYFEALTRAEGRTVQLTPIWDGGDAPCSPLSATPVREGRFRVRAIDGANPGQRFYWEVKAVRADVAPLEVERPRRR